MSGLPSRSDLHCRGCGASDRVVREVTTSCSVQACTFVIADRRAGETPLPLLVA
jgi:hypothetical protein